MKRFNIQTFYMLCGLQGINADFLNDNTFRKPFTTMSQVSMCTQIFGLSLPYSRDRTVCSKTDMVFFFVIYFIFQRNDKDYDNIITIRNCRDRIRSLLISKESHSVAQFRHFEIRRLYESDP